MNVLRIISEVGLFMGRVILHQLAIEDHLFIWCFSSPCFDVMKEDINLRDQFEAGGILRTSHHYSSYMQDLLILLTAAG